MPNNWREPYGVKRGRILGLFLDKDGRPRVRTSYQIIAGLGDERDSGDVARDLADLVKVGLLRRLHERQERPGRYMITRDGLQWHAEALEKATAA